MPANNRDRKVREEAQFFCSTKSLYPIQCKHFKPTLEDIKSATFSDYVRNVVLAQCEEGYNDEDEENDEIVGETHGTRSRSKIGNSKRYEANSRKINYDYGKLLCYYDCCGLFAMHFNSQLTFKPLCFRRYYFHQG